MPLKSVDLAVIGAGAAGAHTLLRVLANLQSSREKRRRPPRITVFDAHPHFFSGVAYGPRSGRASLTLSPLQTFLPDEERADFIEWLRPLGGSTNDEVIDDEWAERHRSDIVAGRLEHLHVPRRSYGEFLAGRVGAAVEKARLDDVADVAFVNATVGSVRAVGHGYVLQASHRGGEQSELGATSVVLAIGSPRCDD